MGWDRCGCMWCCGAWGKICRLHTGGIFPPVHPMSGGNGWGPAMLAQAGLAHRSLPAPWAPVLARSRAKASRTVVSGGSGGGVLRWQGPLLTRLSLVNAGEVDRGSISWPLRSPVGVRRRPGSGRAPGPRMPLGWALSGAAKTPGRYLRLPHHAAEYGGDFSMTPPFDEVSESTGAFLAMISCRWSTGRMSCLGVIKIRRYRRHTFLSPVSGISWWPGDITTRITLKLTPGRYH